MNAWTLLTIDVDRGMVFLAVGSPAFGFYGGDRKGADLYGDCLVALNARTGKLIWYYQLVHHDIWDYDPPAAPDRMKQGIEQLHAALDQADIRHVFYESPGTNHEWQTWRRDLNDFAPRLFQGATQQPVSTAAPSVP